LCDIVNKKNTKLPPDVEEKRKSIENMCKKLAADDQVSSTGGVGGSHALKSFPRWAFPLCAIAGACYLGYKRQASLPRTPVTAGTSDISKARDARMKRFAQS
jgi:hypothetical protein